MCAVGCAYAEACQECDGDAAAHTHSSMELHQEKGKLWCTAQKERARIP